VLDAGPTTGGAYQFPDAASLRISFSSVRSATAFRSLVFSASSSFNRFTWSSFSPPNSCRQALVHALDFGRIQCPGLEVKRPAV
jgi:hypothetical protein